MLTRWIMGKDMPNDRKKFFWNMMGSTMYAASSVLLTYLTIRLIGEDDGGVFAIALTLAQLFANIVYYETRNYHVTDTANRYSYKEYHGVKLFLCAVMLVVCAIYCCIKQYGAYKFTVVMLVCVYRMLDGYADVYEAEFHYRKRLDVAGKSMFYRGAVSMSVYFIVLIITHNLIYALCGAVISGVVGVWLFDVAILKNFCSNGLGLGFRKMKGIIIDCFPFFAGVFLWTYLLSASRMAVDDIMSSEYQSYYQTLFLPVSVINLLAGFLMRPSLIGLTELYVDKEKKIFWKKICRIISIVSGFTLVCMIAAFLIGIPVLAFIVNCDLTPYRNLFVLLIFAGGLNAVDVVLYNVLTIFRRGKSVMSGYIMASIFAYISSHKLVQLSGLWGAGLSYLLSVAILMVVFVIAARKFD